MNLFVWLILFFLAGCHSVEEPSSTSFTGTAMTINYRIVVGSQLTQTQASEVKALIQETFHEVDLIYNKWNPQSEISRLNQLEAGVCVQISPKLETLLKKTEQIVFLSEGRFDPTIEPLQALWKKAFEQNTMPSEMEIHSLMPAIGWHHIHLKNGVFFKDHDLTQLDLGGIAKGYCVDLLIERLNDAGYPHVLVEWGGELRASGQHPDNRPWNIFISRLGSPDPEHAISRLSLENQAIATSGDYQQYWVIEKTCFFHIFDPKTLQPLKITESNLASVSVLAKDCAFADGLATTLMLFPTEKEAHAWAKRIQEQFPETAFWLASREE